MLTVIITQLIKNENAMRIHTLSEAVLAKYAPKPLPIITQSIYSSGAKTRGATLKDLYDELNSKQKNNTESFHSKNADEIESMMMQNRRLIEAQRKNKR